METVHSNWNVHEDPGPLHPLPTMLGIERDGDHRRLLSLPDESLEFWIPEKALQERDFGQAYLR